MNNIAIIYKSKYGTTKQYAEWIAEALDAKLMEASSVSPAQLESFDAVIYGGGLYAGGISGIKLITKNPCKLLTVFTVGIADPKITDYSIILNKNLPKELLAKTKIFHLRGGINYEKSGFIHKGMMSMLKSMLEKKAESELTDDDRALLATYGSKVDYTDKSAIQPIVAFVKECIEI